MHHLGSEDVVSGRTVVLVEELGEKVGERLVGEGATKYNMAAHARHPRVARVLRVGDCGLDQLA